MDAKKQTIRGDEALGVRAGVDQLYAAKGKRVVHVDLRKGRTLLVGFDESTYKQVLG